MAKTRAELALTAARTAAKLNSYDAEKALAICEAIAEGKTVVEVCALEGMPSRPTLYRWLTAFPEFHDAYERAREISAQAMEDEALEMARVLKDKNDFNGVKVRAYDVAMGQLRWSAARRDPGRYGAKSETTQPMAIQINTTLNLGQDGQPATTGDSNVYTLTAEIPVHPSEEWDLPLDGKPLIVDNDPFGIPEKQQHKLGVRSGGRPKGTFKGHKTPEQTRATIAAYGRRKKKEVKNGNGPTGPLGPDAADDPVEPDPRGA